MLGVTATKELDSLYHRWRMLCHDPGTLPVPIRQLAMDDGWRIFHVHDIDPLYAFALISDTHRWICVNASISRQWQRVGIAHEIGHVVNGDEPGLHYLTPGTWLWNKQELRATMVAAELLIPNAALALTSTIEELGALCDVPYEIAELRVSGLT